MTLNVLQEPIMKVIKSYGLRGFNVKAIFVHIQFEGFNTQMNGVIKVVNVVSRQEHVPEMEQFIRVIEERSRASYAILPFTKLPKKIVPELLKSSFFYINTFPWPQGVSQELSPYTTIVEGVVLDYNLLHFQTIFGKYAFFSLDTGELTN